MLAKPFVRFVSPPFACKNETKVQGLITRGSMVSSVIAKSLCSFTGTSFSLNIKSTGKLGEGFGMLLTPPVHQGDLLCIFDLVES